MFFFVRKKKMEELEEKFNNLCNDIRVCNNEIQKLKECSLQSLSVNSNAILAKVDNTSDLISEKVERISTEISEEKEFIISATTKELKKQEKLIKKLNESITATVTKLTDMDIKEDEIIKLGKDISEQLLQLDESTRLLLINTIMSEIPLEESRE